MANRYMKHTMFARYGRSSDSAVDDVMLVKERLRDPVSGKERPNVRLVYNYKRPFGITKKGLRTHEQKKDFEYIKNLDMYEATSAEMPFKIAKILGNHSVKVLSRLCRSPYVYGTDVTSPVLYLHEARTVERKHNGDWIPSMNVAVLDFETDVDRNNNVIWIGGVSFKDKVLVVLTEEYVKGLDPETISDKIKEYADKFLHDIIVERNIKIKSIVAKTEADVVIRLMRFCHTLKPDIVAIWNSGFDIQRMLTALERARINPADVFSDPCVPKAFRSFKFTPGNPVKKTTSGRTTPNSSEDLWHKFDCLASFQVVCAMATYKLLRTSDGSKRSFSADNILTEELGIRKLEYDIPEVKGAQHNTDWHRAMARHHKIVYAVYNIFDCIGIELLDEKTKDLSNSLDAYVDGSEFSQAKSNPRRLCNLMHFYLRDQGKLIASTSDNMSEDLDKFTLNKRNWIVTLHNELTADIGAGIWKPEYRGDLISRIGTHIWDIDVSSGYPSSEIALNAGRGTTLVEVGHIQGFGEQDLRSLAINMGCVPANAFWMGKTFLGLPDVNKLTQSYQEYKQQINKQS